MGADTVTDARAGKLNGAAGIGAVAFRKRGGVCLATNFRSKETLNPKVAPARILIHRALIKRSALGSFPKRSTAIERRRGHCRRYSRLERHAAGMDRKIADALARRRLHMGIRSVNYHAPFRNIVRGVVLVASGVGRPDQGN
jgi:hypothetical protein